MLKILDKLDTSMRVYCFLLLLIIINTYQCESYFHLQNLIQRFQINCIFSFAYFY